MFIAHLDIHRERLERYYRTTAMEPVRPVVLIDEIPWGEIRDEALIPTCSGEWANLEGVMRRTLYQWDHFRAELVVPPVFKVRKRIGSSDIGIAVQEVTLKGSTGSKATTRKP